MDKYVLLWIEDDDNIKNYYLVGLVVELKCGCWFMYHWWCGYVDDGLIVGLKCGYWFMMNLEFVYKSRGLMKL